MVNFLAYYESTEHVMEEKDTEVASLLQKKGQCEKLLYEKRKHLDKCKQVRFSNRRNQRPVMKF